MKKKITILALIAAVATLSACSLFNTNKYPEEPVSEPVSVVEEPSETVNNDLSPIVGQWNEMDVLDSRLLTVYEDGTYSLEYRGGGTAYGTVSVDFETLPDGRKSRWYTFYDNNGEEFASFNIDSDVDDLNDIYSGQDGDMHFSRVIEGQDSAVSADDFLGVWGCGRYTITVEEVNGIYDVQVSWAQSAAEYSFWHYNCTYNAEYGILESSDGVRTNTVVDESGESSGIIEYEGGVASFSVYNGALIWVDQEQGEGDGIEFLR